MRCARCLIPLVGASFLALTSSFSAAAASGPVTYTMSYSETAALLGYTQQDLLSNPSGIAFKQYMTPQNESPYYRTCLSSWQSNYTINGVPYIGIRVYGDRSTWLNNSGQLDCQININIRLDNLYNFVVNCGFLGADASGDYVKSQCSWMYFQDGIEKHSPSISINRVRTAINVDSGSSTDFATIGSDFYPLQASAPVYSFYTISGSSNSFNSAIYGVRNISSNLTYDGVTYTGYTYFYFRCPTLTADPDAMEEINDKLDSITNSLSPSDDDIQSAQSAVSAAQDAAQSATSAISGIDNFISDNSFTVPDSPVYPTDGLSFLTILTNWWQQHQLVVTVSVTGMALAAVSYVLYGKKT